MERSLCHKIFCEVLASECDGFPVFLMLVRHGNQDLLDQAYFFLAST